jgi:hypothetical protein
MQGSAHRLLMDTWECELLWAKEWSGVVAVGVLVPQKAGSLCILCVYTWVRHVWCGLWRDTSLLAVAGSEAPCESLHLGVCFCVLWVAVHTAPGDMKAPVSPFLCM